jgi:hypothetical protein
MIPELDSLALCGIKENTVNDFCLAKAELLVMPKVRAMFLILSS